MKIPSVNVRLGESVCNSAGKLSLLHVQQSDGTFCQLQGSRVSGGTFSGLITSRAGIVSLLAPTLPGPVVSAYGRSRSSVTIEHRGLFIVRTNFGESDWLLAVEDQFDTCDPGWVYHLVMGRLPNGIKSPAQLANSLYLRYSIGLYLEPSEGELQCLRFNLL